MVSGCGLGTDTTTSLAALGISNTTEEVLGALKKRVETLSRKE
jgi:hypothetical protein